MKLFISMSTNGVFYRGIEGTYDPDYVAKTHSIIWVTQDKEYASLYAGDNDPIPFRINIKNPFNFRFRTLSVHVKLEDMFSRMQVQLMDLFETKLSRDRAIAIDDRLDEVREKYKHNHNLKQIWEWWTNIPEIT